MQNGQFENAERVARDAGLELRRDERGIALVDGAMEVRGDFARLLERVKPNNLGGELLLRAVGTKRAFSDEQRRPLVVDATAGLGEDAFLLAAAGFWVTMFERNPVVALLLRDALERAADDERLAPTVARMELVEGDSVAGLRALDRAPDVVLLDPMFPARRKSGLVGKKAQLLQRLEKPCGDEAELLAAARGCGAARIVIKRPRRAPALGGVKPRWEIKGKAVRFDVVV